MGNVDIPLHQLGFMRTALYTPMLFIRLCRVEQLRPAVFSYSTFQQTQKIEIRIGNTMYNERNTSFMEAVNFIPDSIISKE